MFEDDPDVGAYRDAVLWLGAMTRLTPRETVSVCQKILSSGRSDRTAKKLIGLGLFVLDNGKGSLLAIPRHESCLSTVLSSLRAAGLGAAARRLAKSRKKR